MTSEMITAAGMLVTALQESIDSALNGEIEGIFALVFFVLGFACSYSLVYQIRIRNWPTTRGMLLRSKVAEFGVTEMTESDVDYVVSVAYEYKVDNQRYTSDRFSPWVVVASRNVKFILDRQLNEVEADGSVDVFYNPRKPWRAFLRRPGITGMLLTLAFAVFCFVTPVLIFGS